MKKNMHKYNSISFRLTIIFIVIVLLQGMIMSTLLLAGGVISQTQENAFSYFSTQVNSRKSSLENEMKNVWTNFGSYTDELKQYITLQRSINNGIEQDPDLMLEGVAPYLLSILQSTKTTGVFLILDDEDEESRHSALYIRNMAPSNISTDNYNYIMMVGPWNVSKAMNLTTSEKWAFKLKLTDENNAFYEKPYQNIGLTDNAGLLGYWSPPFSLIEGDEKVITYSIPLRDSSGAAIGVFGVEISLDYLYQFLPKYDLQKQDSYGYIIGMRSDNKEPIVPIVMKDTLQERVLKPQQPLELSLIDQENSIYEIENTFVHNSVYASIEKMGMYYTNTPFDHEEWFLIGMMEKPELLKLSNKISIILIVSLIITLCTGSVGAVVVSRRFTKSIINLSNEVRKGSCDKLEATGLTEIDDLAEAITLSHRGMLELTEKLKKERDKDPLTGIRNRNAFNRTIQFYNEQLNENTVIAMGMFDLNGLKYVNDRYGHEAGDQYICVATQIICQSFSTCPIFRIGGDEFAVIMVNVGEEEIDFMHRGMCKEVKKNGDIGELDAGIAFGYAFYEYGRDVNLENVGTRADLNMYINKKKMKELS